MRTIFPCWRAYLNRCVNSRHDPGYTFFDDTVLTVLAMNVFHIFFVECYHLNKSVNECQFILIEISLYFILFHPLIKKLLK
mgnify:CR=1 FL=1